jgi:hypothetical protein
VRRAVLLAALASGCSTPPNETTRSAAPASASASHRVVVPQQPSAPAPAPSASAADAPRKRCLPPKATAKARFEVSDWPIENGDLSPDGCSLVVTNGFGEALYIDVETWTVRGRLQRAQTERHTDAWFIDDERVVLCGHDTKVRVWTGASDPTVLVDHAPSAPCRSLAVDRAAGRVASVHYDSVVGWTSTVRISTTRGEVLATREAPAKFYPVLSGDTLALRGEAARWFIDWKTNAAPSRTPPAGAKLERIGSGARYLEVGPAQVLRLRDFADAPDGKEVALPSKLRGFPRTAAFTPDQAGLFVFFQTDLSGRHQGLALFDAASLEEKRFTPLHWASEFRFATATPTAAVFDGMDVHFVDTTTGEVLATGTTGAAPAR